MRKFFGVLAFLSFFWLYGTIGAVEQNMLSLGTGTIHMVLALTCFYVFCKLAGAFYPTQKRKAVPGVADRRTASVNAQSDYTRLFEN